MTRRTMMPILAGCLLVAIGRAADEPLPKADALLDRVIEATGGKAAWEKRKSELTIVEMEFTGKGIKGTITRWADTSNNTYSSGEIEGVGKIEEGVYNGQAWENSPVMGPRVKTGAENADAVRESVFNAPLHWREQYKAETEALETVAGEECYRIRLTPVDGGQPQTVYVSRKTGLVMKLVHTLVSPMGEMKVEMTSSDYKPFDGVLSPTKMVQTVMGNQIELRLVSQQANVNIPKDRFEPPAEVKKLMAKPAAK